MLVPQDFLHGLCFFFGVLLQFFLAVGSGSLHRLQGLQTKNIREEPTKQRRALSNVLAQDFVQRLCFFFGWSSSSFLFWIRKPSSATKIEKFKNTWRKQQNPRIVSMCGPRTFFRGFGFLFSLFFRFYPCFCFWIRMFPCATRIAKQPKKNFRKSKKM